MDRNDAWIGLAVLLYALSFFAAVALAHWDNSQPGQWPAQPAAAGRPATAATPAPVPRCRATSAASPACGEARSGSASS